MAENQGAGYKPISDYGLIGNMRSAALVAKDGSIDWCCLPRFDSPSAFAAILDDEKGGYFQLKPQLPFETEQSYLPDTNVLQTIFQTETGTVRLTDFMPCYQLSNGRLVQYPEIHRLLECLRGEVSLDVLFEPKLNYARDVTTLTSVKAGVIAENGQDILALSATVPLVVSGNKMLAQVHLKRGEKAAFILRHGSDKPLMPVLRNSINKLDKTSAFWKRQVNENGVISRWREPIIRSFLTLHLMVYSPTGAIIAAPTTSLPEEIGGERNWDYRYAWLRDTSWTVNAFSLLGHKEEAIGFMNWLLKVCDICGAKAQILHDIDFHDPLDEQLLPHLKGYRNSKPVRIGNGAYHQLQLDVFGEVLEAAYNSLEIGVYISRKDWGILESFVNAACETWQQPDSGIWEVRSGLHHFVHSKLMCWVAVDRGIKLAEKLGYAADLQHWREAAQVIKEDILSKGWNSERQSFTQHYQTTALDASNLLMPLYGFLPVTDPRVKSTFERTVAELGWNGLLRRYITEETDDGIDGSEGAFLWCSFWLVRNLIRMDRIAEARALYQKLLGYSNHLGLFSEMVDPVSGEAIGNFPQALTHLAVIITGLELNQYLPD